MVGLLCISQSPGLNLRPKGQLSGQINARLAKLDAEQMGSRFPALQINIS